MELRVKKRLVFIFIFQLSLCFPLLSHAEEAQTKAPFTWPAAYSISGDRSCQGHAIPVTYTVDGSKSRTDLKITKESTMVTIMRGTRRR